MSRINLKSEMEKVDDRTHLLKEEQTPLVAIKCAAYNQELYIREALDGFVKQQTNFPFVAIVHDDASTDSTADIIREYAEKYPEIIKPIFETENQYSKKDGSWARIMDEAICSTGAKYIAYCEGDDYWTDPLKLQKQVDYMEANPECSMCFTNCVAIDGTTGAKVFQFDNYEESQDAPMEDLILRGGAFCATPTFLIRRDLYENMPLELKRQYVGDYTIQMYMGHVGKVHYLKDITANYRYAAVGSWSIRVQNTSFEKRVSEFWPKNDRLFRAMDESTNRLYSELLNGAMTDLMFWDCRRYGRYFRALKLWPKLYKPIKRYGLTTMIEIMGVGYVKRLLKRVLGKRILD